MAAPSRQTVLQSCGFNCGSRCQLRLQVEDGRVAWVETDNAPDSENLPALRACLCGRAWGHWVHSPQRLNYPLKRTGPRGSGQFQRISWDEALDETAAQLKRIAETYGPEAIFFPFGTGASAMGESPIERAVNCYCGHLRFHSDYSSAQLQAGAMALFGDDGYLSGSPLEQLEHSDLLVLFGSSPSTTRQGGAASGPFLSQLRRRAAEDGRPLPVVSIDPRHTAEVRSPEDLWIPIRPGTDAAFVAGVIYQLMEDGNADEVFLREGCVGFFEDTLPEGAPSGSSYYAYLQGLGPDGVAKTPEWAASVTGCPAPVVRRLAQRLTQAKSAFITQGWGPQRSEYGEQTARSICLLALASGHFGKPGTNSGVREPMRPNNTQLPGAGENPVRASLPAFMWTEALTRGTGFTAAHGLQGAPQLMAPLKIIVLYGSNCLTNQHAAINATHDLLFNEALCEFIVACDVVLTDSARYADIILPELALGEQENIVTAGYSDRLAMVRQGHAWNHHTAERMSSWEIGLGLAQRLGVESRFTSGLEGSGPLEHHRKEAFALLAETSAGEEGQSGPCGSDANDQAETRAPRKSLPCAYEAFRRNPAACPLPTPSGKVEVYSAALTRLAKTADLPQGQAICPIPAYVPAAEGPEAARAGQFPLQFITYHGHQSIHSNLAHLEIMDSVMPRALQVNPVDGAAFNVADGQAVVVESERGALVTHVHLTPRIMPGVVALPNGAWHDADMEGSRLDWGGCPNTLTSLRPSPIARGNGQNSCLVRLRPLTPAEQTEGRARGYDC